MKILLCILDEKYGKHSTVAWKTRLGWFVDGT